MILTKGQELGLAMIGRLKRDPKSPNAPPNIAVLGGYAGSGKTTLLAKACEALGGMPIIVTPTGKAAIRVKEATGIVASTIHSWLYDVEDNIESGDLVFKPKETMQIKRGEVNVLVIDEASMVNQSLWNDILEACRRCGMNILIVGDPFQLPPIPDRRASEYDSEFSLLAPDFPADERVLMTEIVRQALDNPIINASMLIRAGQIAKAVSGMPKLFPAQVLDKAAEIIATGDGALIVHKNETRNRMNVAVRKALRKPDNHIQDGEPLLVLQNNYRLSRYNGEIVTFKNWIEPPGNEHKIKDWIRKQEAFSKFGIAQLDTNDLDMWGHAAVSVDQIFGRLAHISIPAINKIADILYGAKHVDPYLLSTMSKMEAQELLGPPFLHANFGYCLTAHKAQGSEWNRVIVCLEPSVRMQTEEGCRWIYTAITRSKEECWINIGGPK